MRWDRTLYLGDVFHGEAPFPERRDVMVARIRALDPNDNDGELQCIADELGDAEDEDTWDHAWSDFYDWADSNSVWVQAWAKP